MARGKQTASTPPKGADEITTLVQQGDVPATFASIERLAAATGFAPTTPLAEGLSRFVAWYREYYGGAEPASSA